MGLAEISILTITALTVLTSLLIARWRLRRTDRKIRAYRLYAVRDEFVRLVAEDRLSEDDMIFATFYAATNRLVKNVDQLNLSALVASIEADRRTGTDLAERRKLTELRNRIRRLGDPEVEEAVTSYYKAVARIIYENSLVIRVLVDHKWLRALLRRFVNWINRPKPPQMEIYRDYTRAARQCC